VDGTVRHFPDRPPAPGAETWNQHLTRVTAALRSIVDRHPGQRVLVAGHRETIEAAYALMMAARPNAAGPASAGRADAASRADATVVGVDVEHTGLTRWCLRTDAQGFATWLLTQHNDATHLWCG
jgi:probable phosphoglycerate mutase